MKIIKRKELGLFSTFLLFFVVLFLPAIVGQVFWGDAGYIIGVLFSLGLLGIDYLDKCWTNKIKTNAFVVGIDHEAKMVEFNFNGEIFSKRLPAYEVNNFWPKKLNQAVPVNIKAGKIFRAVNEIDPI